jgi:hypothetical protein
MQGQHASPDYSDVPEGFVLVVDPVGVRYAVPANVAHHYGKHVQHRQQRQQNEITEDLQRQNTGIEHQRSIIFELGDKITRLFGHDYRLIAAAVPHIPFLKKYNIGHVTSEKWDELKRQLNEVFSHRHFPNGERIKPMRDPRDYDEVPDSKTPTKKHPAAPEVAKECVRPPPAAYDDTAEDRGWLDEPEPEGEYAHIHKLFREEQRKEREEERKKRHDERAHRKKHEGEESKKKEGESRHGSDASSSQYHYSYSTHTSERESQKGKTDGQKDKKTEGHKNNDSASGGWGSTLEISKEAQGDWDKPDGEKEGDKQPDNNYQTIAPTPPTDGHNETKPTYKAPSIRSQPHSLRSSNKTSKTINPNAAIQPYFDVLHPNNPKTGNSRPNSHQTPIARTPYVYPPTQAPHLSSSALGNRSHGVRAGKGAEYTHATLRPKYLDTMERPYAVFVFEYRSVEKLGEILGRRGEDLGVKMEKVEEEVGMGVLMGFSKEKLVEELLKARGNGGGGGEGAAAATPEIAPPQQQQATNGTADWAAKVQPWTAPEPAAALAAFKTATTRSHHSHSRKSENKNKTESKEAPKAPTAGLNAWSIGGRDVVAECGGFVPAAEGNVGATW